MSHACLIREDRRFSWLHLRPFRSGIADEFTIICACGWRDKTRTEREAVARAKAHEQKPYKHVTIIPS